MDNKHSVNSEEDVIEIDILELLGVVWSKIWIILCSAVSAAVVTYLICAFLITPKYQSTTKIYVINRQNSEALTYSDLQSGTQLTKDYKELVTSRPVLEQVKSELGLAISTEKLKKKITVTVPTDTRIVSITAEDTNPVTAKAIADSVRTSASKHIADVMNIEAVNVVEEGNIPTKVSSPKTIKNTFIATVLGALFALLIIVIIYILDDTIKNPDDVEKHLNLSVLGSIPALNEERVSGNFQKSKKNKKTKSSHVVVTETLSNASKTVRAVKTGTVESVNPDGQGNLPKNHITINKKITLDFRLSEAFKALRTNIDFCGEDVKVIAFTSCAPGEGKSSVAFNLAISMTEAGKKVLFIDADMRKSVLNGRYQMSSASIGLAHFLAGRFSLEECIYMTNIPKLCLIPTGAVPPNPAELLSTKRLERVIGAFRDHFDYIIIDTPPLGSVIDSAIVAKQCDGVVLVTQTKTIGRSFAKRVVEQLQKAECKILGVVLNKIEIDGKFYGKYYGKYYGQYYGSYYGK